MRLPAVFATVAALVFNAGANNLTALPDDPAGRALIQQAERIIAAYHQGQPPASNVLRVVYFVPKDADPLPHYAERLDRVANDVNHFYTDGLRRFGLATTGLPLEREDGKLVVHLVRGQWPAKEYAYESGSRTAEEIRQALKSKINMDREFLLVFYALGVKSADGRYVFNSPYYGSGSQRNGLCHAADCEWLDPLLLRETNRSMVFTEHYYPHFLATLAKFNTMYLGGTAHELGHALGLPHDDGSGPERSFGHSLMGRGNLFYRQELWSHGDPVYLARASALQLASHPLVTGSDRGRWDNAESAFESIKFSDHGGALRIEGVVTGVIPPYAVIAYAWPASDGLDDHAARTFPCVLQDGAFSLDLAKIPLDKARRWHLKLARLHVNGASFAEEFPLSFNDSSAPDVAALNAAWIVQRAESAVMAARPDARKFVSDEVLASAPTAEAERKLRLLRTVLDPPAPIDLAAAQAPNVFLSDASWTEAKVGWGQVARNYFWFDRNIQNGVFLTLGGRFYDKGLYAHSPARYVFDLGGKWQTFTATIGLRDGAQLQGSAIFTVRGDGRELYRSRLLRVGEQAQVSVDIAQVKKLELLTEGGEGHNHNSWAIWVEPRVNRLATDSHR